MIMRQPNTPDHKDTCTRVRSRKQGEYRREDFDGNEEQEETRGE